MHAYFGVLILTGVYKWLQYTPIGKQIRGTRFVAFKVPLKEHIANTVLDETQLTCNLLLEEIPNLGMVIDLTNTYRYYDPYEFTKRGVIYKKLMIPGHHIPPQDALRTFKNIVWEYLQKNSNNSTLIGVHCTHGVNRTGYIICDFMISELNFDVNDAVQRFQQARGHQIERKVYLDDLRRRKQASQFRYTNFNNQRSKIPKQNKRF